MNEKLIYKSNIFRIYIQILIFLFVLEFISISILKIFDFKEFLFWIQLLIIILLIRIPFDLFFNYSKIFIINNNIIFKTIINKTKIFNIIDLERIDTGVHPGEHTFIFKNSKNISINSTNFKKGPFFDDILKEIAELKRNILNKNVYIKYKRNFFSRKYDNL